MDTATADWFTPLQCATGRLGLEQLRRWLDEVSIGLEDVQPWVRFNDRRYQRNLMLRFGLRSSHD